MLQRNAEVCPNSRTEPRQVIRDAVDSCLHSTDIPHNAVIRCLFQILSILCSSKIKCMIALLSGQYGQKIEIVVGNPRFEIFMQVFSKISKRGFRTLPSWMKNNTLNDRFGQYYSITTILEQFPMGLPLFEDCIVPITCAWVSLLPVQFFFSIATPTVAKLKPTLIERSRSLSQVQG